MSKKAVREQPPDDLIFSSHPYMDHVKMLEAPPCKVVDGWALKRNQTYREALRILMN